ncbi:hypothetical protein ABT112_23685 [Streptomyces sp. NPDC002055]|uniref:hypothetical protein n=1 Tax=Streptomyces sp. NPDC002055 TaxID=3154534 RepID=UPI00332BEA3F
MDDSTKKTLAAAVAAGYVLGRTKKGKLALGLAALAAGSKLNPQELVTQGVRKLAENPQFEQLSQQVRGELLGSGRSALSAAANRGLGSVTDALGQRTRALQGGEEAPEEDEEEDAFEDEGEEEEEEEEEEAATDEGEEDEPEPEEQEPRKRRRPTKKSRESEPTDKKAAAKKAPPKKSSPKQAPKKAAAKKTSAKKAPAKKTPAKKAATKKAPARSGRRR